MGMFGTYATPQGMPAGPYDPTMQVKQAGPRRLGMLGQIAQALTGPTGGRNLQIAGATLRQLGGGANSNTLSELLAQLQQQDQQRLQNTWQQTLQQRQQGEWNSQDKQQARLSDWATQQGGDAAIDPQAAFQAHQLASQPLTPYQQRQLDQQSQQFNASQATTRRGQDLDLEAAALRAANAGGGLARLRGPDASQLTRVQQAGESARQLQQFAQQFQDANRQVPSGLGSDVVNYFNPNTAAMRQTSALMRGLLRPIGSGSTSDYEQRLYSQGPPDPSLPGPANDERIRNIQRLADISNARQFFYENYADANGTLRGAEQAFQASPDFRELTRSEQRSEQRSAQTAAPAQPAANAGAVPNGVDPQIWQHMTPQERALWQNH